MHFWLGSIKLNFLATNPIMPTFNTLIQVEFGLYCCTFHKISLQRHHKIGSHIKTLFCIPAIVQIVVKKNYS